MSFSLFVKAFLFVYVFLHITIAITVKHLLFRYPSTDLFLFRYMPCQDSNSPRCHFTAEPLKKDAHTFCLLLLLKPSSRLSFCKHGLIPSPPSAKSEQNPKWLEGVSNGLMFQFLVVLFCQLTNTNTFSSQFVFWSKRFFFFFLEPNNNEVVYTDVLVDWSDTHRLKNVQNKMPMQTVSVKPSHLSKQNENKDPANTETVKKASLLPRVSRLPVPVKNLRLQTPSDFTQSHCKWEEKPLTVSVFCCIFSCFNFYFLFCWKFPFITKRCVHRSYRVRQGKRSRAPGQYLSTCHSPGAQEWPQMKSHSTVLRCQGLPAVLCTIVKI